MRTKAFTREERKRMILLAFAAEHQNGNSGEMTTADIARWMHITPSGKLRSIINEMVTEGELETRVEAMPGVVGFRVIYRIRQDSERAQNIVHLRNKRSIRINGQLSLFQEDGGE